MEAAKEVFKNTIKKEFQEITKIKIFEIPVIETKTQEKEYITFILSIDGDQLKAQHVGLTNKENQSENISFKYVDLENCFSLDEHLQNLHEICTNAILESDLFNLDENP